jgi:glycolate oxidase FAD binding subunit
VVDISRHLLEQVRDARSEGRSLQVSGAASKPWMGPGTAGRLSVAEHTGIVSYDPAELVVTVRAGTPLAELDAALGERGQMLAMEAPDFNGGSTIGGAVALGWAGSRSAFAGGVRDAVLGIRMINGQGEELRFGGEVVKNVAGFDVARAMIGSCGRMGLLLELSLKLVPRPRRDVTLAWSPADLADSRAMVDAWTGQAYPVSAASYYDGRLRVRFSGPGELLDEVSAKLGGEPEDDGWWRALRRLELPMFHHGWGDEKLFDGNGEICWTAHSRRRGHGPAVDLAKGPDFSRAPNQPLLSRVLRAFDPGGLFQAGEAT